MQCSCGGETTDHEVVRDKQPIAQFRRCTACGRIMWIWGEDELKACDRAEVEAQASLFDESVALNQGELTRL